MDKDTQELVFDDYDAGYLNDHGGGDIDWWHDYIRAEIERANEYWQDQITALQQSQPVQQEAEQWRCFQCDEVFTDKEKAAEHFGVYQHQRPACTIDVAEYRRMEELHRQYLNEETEKDRAMYSMQSKHQTELRRAEEDGYNKGITERREHFEGLAQQPNIGDALREKLEGMRFDLSLLAASDACFNELEAKCEAFDEAISIADSMSGVTAQPIEDDKQ